MHHLIVENLTIKHIVARTMMAQDERVDQFIIRNCRFIGWAAADRHGRMPQGVVEDCYFHGEEGFDNSEAIQMKGCATTVQCCFFDRAGRG